MSRRTLELPQRCVGVLRLHRDRQDQLRQKIGDRWHDNDLVFASAVGTQLNAANVRRAFRKVALAAGLDAENWTPRELRHSFVSLMSDAGVPIENIARLVGHSSTSTTELVYRHQIRPVVQGGATVMDRLFPGESPDA
jgi:integrase